MIHRRQRAPRVALPVRCQVTFTLTMFVKMARNNFCEEEGLYPLDTSGHMSLENSRYLKDKSPCRDKKAVPPDL